MSAAGKVLKNALREAAPRMKPVAASADPRNVFAPVPFMQLLGVRREFSEGGRARLVLDARPEFGNVIGAVHGGVIVTLLDVVMASAAVSSPRLRAHRRHAQPGLQLHRAGPRHAHGRRRSDRPRRQRRLVPRHRHRCRRACSSRWRTARSATCRFPEPLSTHRRQPCPSPHLCAAAKPWAPCSPLGAAVAAGPALAADPFPSKPIQLVLPFPPGGSFDPIFRSLANAASQDLGQPIVLMHKPGAGGVMGTARLATMNEADGYTLAVMHNSVIRAPLVQKVTWDPLRDFTYLIGLAGLDHRHHGGGGRALEDACRELLDDAKKRPGASAGATWAPSASTASMPSGWPRRRARSSTWSRSRAAARASRR